MSPSCQRFTGYSAAEFKQDRSLLLRIVHPEDRAQVAEHECEARGCDREMLVDFRVLARDGHERWVSHVCVPVHDQDGTPQGRRISNRDITDRKRLEAQLQHLASHDSLTGLLGRAELQRRFQGELERALRYGRPLALLMFDADHFKAINDRHGHLAGDRVLAALAQCMRTNLRGSDLVGRYGGEEFLAVLPETGIEQAAAMAERLRRRVAARDFAPPGAVQLAVTVSVGVAALGLHGDDPEALVDAADQALYAAKAAGRDRVVCAAALG
jgi:diguanylate cyclase (GGDEF)-like protein/PAS domain S-box-containing protein